MDDGSPDNCPQICDEYGQKDTRIRVIHKQNQGLGMARNTGIEHATGDYICFFDSDDFIVPETIAVTLAAALEHRADLVIFGHEEVTPAGVVSNAHIPCPPKQLYCEGEITQILLPAALYGNPQTGTAWNIPLCAWNKLYAMDVIRRANWRFASEREIISEDFYSLTKLFGYLQRVYIVDRAFYRYTVNNTSLSRSYRADRFERIQNFRQQMLQLSDKMGLRKILERPIDGITFGFSIGAMKLLMASDLGWRERYATLRRTVKDERLRCLASAVLSDKCNWQKRILCFAIQQKLTWLCYFLVSLRNKQES